MSCNHLHFIFLLLLQQRGNLGIGRPFKCIFCRKSYLCYVALGMCLSDGIGLFFCHLRFCMLEFVCVCVGLPVRVIVYANNTTSTQTECYAPSCINMSDECCVNPSTMVPTNSSMNMCLKLQHQQNIEMEWHRWIVIIYIHKLNDASYFSTIHSVNINKAYSYMSHMLTLSVHDIRIHL